MSRDGGTEHNRPGTGEQLPAVTSIPNKIRMQVILTKFRLVVGYTGTQMAILRPAQIRRPWVRVVHKTEVEEILSLK